MEIHGLYGRTLFRNEGTGLTTFSFNTTSCCEQKNSRGELICNGIVPVYSYGTPVLLQGDLKNTEFGWEFSVINSRPYSNKKELTINYLSSGDFEGIGEKTAVKLLSSCSTLEEVFANASQLAKGKQLENNYSYIIKGDVVEKLFKMTNFNTEEALLRFSHKLRKMGVDDELERMGIEEGDIVRIMDYEFEYTK